ncbi:MAG: flagellar protein FliT [Lachnospiraceae bacterium]|nr:flagellar protein FliT [Lachnospiraceae bacterium]
MENYLSILEESLQKKLKLLDEIQVYNEKQQQIFSSATVDMEMFDEAIAEKGSLVERVVKLDEGFEKLYANVSEELKGNRTKYAEQIRKLQQMIQQVTDKSVSVQAQEVRNKALVEAYFAKEKKQIGQGRRSSAAAYNYYNNARKVTAVEPQFMDSRQ